MESLTLTGIEVGADISIILTALSFLYVFLKDKKKERKFLEEQFEKRTESRLNELQEEKENRKIENRKLMAELYKDVFSHYEKFWLFNGYLNRLEAELRRKNNVSKDKTLHISEEDSLELRTQLGTLYTETLWLLHKIDTELLINNDEKFFISMHNFTSDLRKQLEVTKSSINTKNINKLLHLFLTVQLELLRPTCSEKIFNIYSEQYNEIYRRK